MIRVGVTGATGRMGAALIRACQAREDMRLAAATVRHGSELTGTDAGAVAGLPALGVPLTDALGGELHVLVDFTTPEATLEHLAWCRGRGVRLVIGTTGFNDEQLERIRTAAREIPVVLAPNMSVGVNLCFRLVELAAGTLGASSDIEILEAHHRHKADAPSGTALRLGEKAAGAMNARLEDVAVYQRQGRTGPRPGGAIGFATVRAGDIVGEHTVLFAAEGERVEITHKASSRMNFASGALRAAAWLQDRGPGLYDMQDVLGL